MKKRLLTLLIMVVMMSTGIFDKVFADEISSGRENEVIEFGENILAEEEYIEIDDADKLLEVSISLNSIDNSGKKYKLTENIDMSGKNWVMPIYNPTEFDGNGKTITNLNISIENRPEQLEDHYFYGMFNSTTVKNLTLDNTKVSIKYKETASPFIAYGTMTGSGSIENCKLTGKTEYVYDGADNFDCYTVGGMIGCVTGNAIGCTLDGEVDFSRINTQFCGGIIGCLFATSSNKTIDVDECKTTSRAVVNIADNVTMACAGISATVNDWTKGQGAIVNYTNCENRATIKAKYACGICGDCGSTYAKLNMSNCINYADILNLENNEDGTEAYGIVGHWGGDAVISNCINYGKLEASYAAGVVKEIYGKANLSKLVNRGNIKAAYLASGIGLKLYKAETITQSYNIGDIISRGSAAGLVIDCEFIDAEAEISKCFNSGAVRGGYAGGLFGCFSLRNNNTITLSDCFNCGMIYGYPNEHGYAAGLINNPSYHGKTNMKLYLNRCYNVGAVAKDADNYGNQFACYLGTHSEMSGCEFVETDCYYYEDDFSVAMSERDDYSYLTRCQINECGKTEAELKDVFATYTDIWVSGKEGYAYPYLKGVGETDLPVNYDHQKQVKDLEFLSKSDVVLDEIYENYDINDRPFKIIITTDDGNGNKVPVSLREFYSKMDDNTITLQSPKKMKIIGYTFKGWFIDGKKVKKLTKTKLADETKLEAKYTVNKYNIKYKIKAPAKGIKVSGKISPDKKVDYTNEIIMKGSEITAPGYKLVGFTTDKRGSMADFKVGESVPLSKIAQTKKSISLYAIWELDENAL